MPKQPKLTVERPYQYPNEDYDPFAAKRNSGPYITLNNDPNSDFGSNDPLVRKVPFDTGSWIGRSSYDEGPQDRQKFRDFQDQVNYSGSRLGDIALPNQSGRVDPRIVQALAGIKKATGR